MQPATIICPHCRNAVAFDPRFAGHVVACPHCRGSFQMPAPHPSPVPIPVLQPSDPLAFDESSSPATPRRRPKSQSEWSIGRVLLVLTLLFVVVGVSVVVGISKANRPTMSAFRGHLLRLHLEKDKEFDGRTYRVNKAALFRAVGQPNSTQNIGGEVIWFWDCKDGTLQAGVMDGGDTVTFFWVNTFGK